MSVVNESRSVRVVRRVRASDLRMDQDLQVAVAVLGGRSQRRVAALFNRTQPWVSQRLKAIPAPVKHRLVAVFLDRKNRDGVETLGADDLDRLRSYWARMKKEAARG